MNRLLFATLITFAGCTTVPDPIVEPQGLNLVPGGISNTQPYFGSYKTFGSGSDSTPLGTFLLASCGCGDSRVLFKPDDGSPQTQFPIQFYSDGSYVPTGDVTVYGLDDASGRAVLGSTNQDSGAFTGKTQLDLFFQQIDATRGDSHDQPVIACGMCHIGDDSIYPLPPTHPDKYKTNPLVCLECHSVNGG